MGSCQPLSGIKLLMRAEGRVRLTPSTPDVEICSGRIANTILSYTARESIKPSPIC